MIVILILLSVIFTNSTPTQEDVTELVGFGSTSFFSNDITVGHHSAFASANMRCVNSLTLHGVTSNPINHTKQIMISISVKCHSFLLIGGHNIIQ